MRITPDGSLRLDRGVRLKDDIEDLASDGLGIHWTTTIDCATSNHDPCQEAGGYDAILVADALASSVDWPETFRANTAHPWEREVTVAGPVRLIQVVDARDGGILWRPDRVFATGKAGATPSAWPRPFPMTTSTRPRLRRPLSPC
jgi:hypothetical protein